MSKGDFNRGNRDARERAPYNPPHRKPFDTVASHSKKEIQNREDYRQGWRTGKK